jgi:hypothetical protein
MHFDQLSRIDLWALDDAIHALWQRRKHRLPPRIHALWLQIVETYIEMCRQARETGAR